MVLRLNKSHQYPELILRPDFSGSATTFVTFYSECSTPPKSLKMPVKTSFCCPEFSCRKKFSSDTWRRKPLKLHHPENILVACQKNLTVYTTPRRVDRTQRREFNGNNDLVKDVHTFPYLEHFEHIIDSESDPPLPPLSQTETHTCAGTPLSDYIAKP
jgi:hypothetical protein